MTCYLCLSTSKALWGITYTFCNMSWVTVASSLCLVFIIWLLLGREPWLAHTATSHQQALWHGSKAAQLSALWCLTKSPHYSSCRAGSYHDTETSSVLTGRTSEEENCSPTEHFMWGWARNDCGHKLYWHTQTPTSVRYRTDQYWRGRKLEHRLFLEIKAEKDLS